MCQGPQGASEGHRAAGARLAACTHLYVHQTAARREIAEMCQNAKILQGVVYSHLQKGTGKQLPGGSYGPLSLSHRKEQKAGTRTQLQLCPFSKEEHGHGWAGCCVLPKLLPRCGGGSRSSGSPPDSLRCRPVFSLFPLSLLSSFACFNPLKLGKLFNKFLSSPELLDVSQLDTLIRPC